LHLFGQGITTPIIRCCSQFFYYILSFFRIAHSHVICITQMNGHPFGVYYGHDGVTIYNSPLHAILSLLPFVEMQSLLVQMQRMY